MKLESYLRVNLLGPGPRLKISPGRGLTKVEKHCSSWYQLRWSNKLLHHWRQVTWYRPLARILWPSTSCVVHGCLSKT